MNKFKRPTEYPAVTKAPMQQVIDNVLPVSVTKTTDWECIGCADRAVLLHRGTGYCRRCYDKRNYEGTLIA